MPLRHYKSFYVSLQLVLYSFFWRRCATGVLTFCSLLPSPPVQWKICTLTLFIKITLASGSDVSALGHRRKLHLYTQLDKGLHLSSILQNFVLIQIHFCSFQLFWPLRNKSKTQNQPTTKPLCDIIVMSSTSSSLWWPHYWDSEQDRDLCWWHLEPLSFRALQKPSQRRQQLLSSFLCLLRKGLLDLFRLIWPGDSILLHCLLALSFCLFGLITYIDNLRLLDHSNQPVHGSVQQKAAALGIWLLMATMSPMAFSQLHIVLAGHSR